MQYRKDFFESPRPVSKPGIERVGPEQMDRRNHRRYDLQATAHFSWKDAGGTRWQGRGLTRDISETGLFVVTRNAPPSGVAVKVEVRAYSQWGSGLLMQAKGQVVRVEVNEQPASGVGFAAATRSLVLRNCKPDVTAQGGDFDTVSGAAPSDFPGRSRKPN
jgi:hypothetical protein